ncbi:unnamed protein product [Hymenolepis diminuta]|uniref:Ovule protein n=1 Tax=Hymenolepis diminuta TaxID=6216 RepID=A0A0R3SGN6_HYMDI|nr:unnamed protein product [Hymenolepis diminuta]
MVDTKQEEYEMDLRWRANSNDPQNQQSPFHQSRPEYPSSEESSFEFLHRMHPVDSEPDFFSSYNPRPERRGICDLCGYISE